MHRRTAEWESKNRVPYTCPPFEAAAKTCADALEDVLRAAEIEDAHSAAKIASDALDAIEEASEAGRIALRDALIDSILETDAAQAETREAEKERDRLREDNNDMAQQIRELEARVQELENQ